MTSNREHELFLGRLLNALGEPRVTDPAAYLEEVRRAICDHPAEVMDLAATRLIREQRWFPRISEMIEALRREEGLLRAAQRAEEPAPPPPPVSTVSDDERARVQRQMQQLLHELTVRSVINRPVPKQVPLPPSDRPAMEERQRRSQLPWLHRPREPF